MQKGQSKYHDSRAVAYSHRRSLFHDYSDRGIYLITLCTEGRQPLLGTLRGNSADEAFIEPTPLGAEVLRLWNDIPAFQRQAAKRKSMQTGTPITRDISILAVQLMPDHLHGILFVHHKMDIAIGRIIGGFMMSCTQARYRLTHPVSPAGSTLGGSTLGVHAESPSARSTLGVHAESKTTERQADLPSQPLLAERAPHQPRRMCGSQHPR